MNDTLADIIDTIEGALLPMMRSMLPKPTLEQLKLLENETTEIMIRVGNLLYAKQTGFIWGDIPDKEYLAQNMFDVMKRQFDFEFSWEGIYRYEYRYENLQSVYGLLKYWTKVMEATDGDDADK